MKISNWSLRLFATLIVLVLAIGCSGSYLTSSETDPSTTWGVMTIIVVGCLAILGIIWGADDL